MIRNYLITSIILLGLFLNLTAQQQPPNKLLAWCIVPFDNQNRTPVERIKMLETLGLDQYAYDWRKEHLTQMMSEWRLAKSHGIKIGAVWMWLSDGEGQTEQLSPDNNLVIRKLNETGLETQLWVGFHESLFQDIDHQAALVKAQKMIHLLHSKIDHTRVKLALYNHGGWLGEPKNQVDLIRSLPELEIGIVYNFHHAHDQLDEYSANIDLMLPYLWTVNLNGMRKEGPKILPIGEGNLERDMIQVLLDKGYRGSFGILGHVEDADVEKILRDNLKGYQKLWTP